MNKLLTDVMFGIACSVLFAILLAGVVIYVCGPEILQEPPQSFVITHKKVVTTFIGIGFSPECHLFFYTDNLFVEVTKNDYYAYEVGDYFTKNYTILH